MKIKQITALFIGAILASPFAIASEKPPANGKPLVDIITALEDQGYSPITEISFDDNVWEVDTYKGEQARELKVDPTTGEIVEDEEDKW